jgi:NADH dehydrogenase
MTANQTYELGGAKVYSYSEMLDVIAEALGASKRKVNVPVALMKPVVTLSKPLPKSLRPPVTTEQLKMLELDNITESSATAELIGREPVALEDRLDYVRR